MEKSVFPCYIPPMKAKLHLLILIPLLGLSACASPPVEQKRARMGEGQESKPAGITREDSLSSKTEREAKENAETKVPSEEHKGKDEVKTAPEKPASEALEKKQPPQLTADDFQRLLIREGSKEWRPLVQDDEPVFLLHDLDKNGYPDAVSLFVRLEEQENGEEDYKPVDLKRLSDFTRLYAPDAESFGCMVKVFFQEEGVLSEKYNVDLGQRVVLEGFRQISLKPSENGPFSVSVSFQSPEGSVEEWLFFTDGEPGRFTLRETLSSYHEIRDVDEDGFLDVLYFEKSFEAGMGYETYITWFRWNGETFEEYKVTNILRKLNSFLSEVRAYMIEEKWKLFFSHALSDERVRWYKKKGLEPEQTLKQIFTLLGEPNDDKSPPPLSELQIEDVIFPELLENPFQQTKRGSYIFPLRVRVISEEGEFVYISRILLLENPFQNSPFSFIMSREYVSY